MTIRKLGYEIHIGNKLISDLDNDTFYRQFLPLLWQHGLICVKNQQNLDNKSLVKLLNKVGSALRLPHEIAFSNLDSEHPELVRIGNIKPDGTVIPMHKGAEYWHTDGDFWPPGENFVINWLHSRITPNEGGETAFLDTRKAFDELSEEQKQEFEQAEVICELEKISDFAGVNPVRLNMDPVVKHKVVIDHPIDKKKSLYFAGTLIKLKNGTLIDPSEIISKIVEKHKPYVHKYSVGDLLIWDNLQTMHRGMGGFFNHPRLLIRGQSRLLNSHIQVIKKLSSFI